MTPALTVHRYDLKQRKSDTVASGVRFFEVDPDSPAAEAVLQPGEAILAVNGTQYEFLGSASVLTDLQANAGETVTLTVQRPDGSVYTVDATLRTKSEIDASRDENGVAQKGALGISSGDRNFEGVYFGTTGHDLPTALALAAQQTIYWFGLILAGLG